MLAAWRDSPTRLREDEATEADLVRAGYRDRLLTELAQNAADAAAKAGSPGRLAVWLDGRSLHIANTGAPLDRSGVHALTALRASGKSDPAASVGRFGVGFTAVLTVSDEIEIRSTTGSLRFSRAATLDALHQNAIQLPGGAAAGERWQPPALRLVWPSSTGPVTGFDTEVVLRLRDDVDAQDLLSAMRSEVVDLLLELPALREVRVDDDVYASTTGDYPNGIQELRITGPQLHQHWWQFRTARARWLLPVRDGRPVRAAPDVLRAPTRSDEELSLPALLIADIAMQPDRRRLLPGAHVAELACGYADFARALPPHDRLTLVPVPGFARSEADGLLREAVIRELQTHPWLPVIAPDGHNTSSASPRAEPEVLAEHALADSGRSDAEPPGLPGDVLSSAGSDQDAVAVPTRASVFPGLSSELAALLADVLGPLVIPELSGGPHSEALSVLDVHRIGLARLAELSGGLDRAPDWWRELYAALEPYVTDPLAVEELGALAVPLADGRLVTGPRTAVLDDELHAPIPVHWARLIHPEAAHPLLSRLGARQATVRDLLSDPGLRAELEDNPADPDTTDAVLRLAAQADPAELPAWLGLLELTDDTGELLPADELLLPGAPLRAVLVADSPFGTVDQELVDHYGPEALRAVGVGWDFAIVSETDPTGPDHDLPDEEAWWAGLSEDPPELIAVRDLDLVDETGWPQALRQLAAGERTRPLLADRDGYTAWWLRRFAHIDGTPLGVLRHPDEPEFAGLLPEFSAPGFSRAEIDALRPVLADPASITPELAEALLAALADPAKSPSPQVTARTHALLAGAEEHLDLTELELPDLVRALSGATVDPGQAMVLDQPWFGLAIPPHRLVVGAVESAAALATLLDLPLVSEAVTAEVISTGRASTWASEPMGVVLRQLFGLPEDDGDLIVHDELRVRLTGAVQRTADVLWWRDGDTTHIRNPQAGD
ncbi:ATP-binding protein [Nocardia cyriacigeorgica]|uniref:sacsin N-terminal ATP-binding-like domain-containing protein n=1 Tax=Nocardia cyriacigeorgica TaxID=135487 RepID=UPI001893ACF0|nr:ATP-binding protein [Nocardia cyriacigeorgica]MBF6319466.1 ATP-binding protein [Nocardia cyriacigeorgica]MBF6533750.1 ATP-binding protein [Nocardia cyriacigeorgica]